MKKILAKSLLVIIEAGLEVMAERIKKRRSKDGNSDGLDHLRNRRVAYDLSYQSAARPHPLGNWQALKRNAGALYLGSKQKTKKGAQEDDWKRFS